MTTILLHTDIISHCVHWKTKKKSSVALSLVSIESLLRSFLLNRTDLEYRINCDM